MLVNGQAETGPDTLDDAAAFIAGLDDESPGDDENAESQPEEGQGDPEDAPDESADDEAETGDDEAEEKPEDQASVKKFKVTVKGEDGADVTEEVTEAELLAGYQRQKAFTQKTQALAEQSRQAAQLVEQKLTEGRNYYLQQAQAAKSAILQVAGLKSEQELAELAATDPSAWVQEQQRMRAVGGYLSQLDQQIQQEQQKVHQEGQQRYAAMVNRAWEVLSEKGIDKPKLASMYEAGAKAYGYKPEEIQANIDPRSVLMLKDALAYRELQAKKPQVTQKVQTAEKLPAPKKSLPSQDRKNAELNKRFSSGRASRNDLAAWIAANNL